MVLSLTQIAENTVSAASATSEQPKKLKPCCACPETKRARDKWYVSFNI